MALRPSSARARTRPALVENTVGRDALSRAQAGQHYPLWDDSEEILTRPGRNLHRGADGNYVASDGDRAAVGWWCALDTIGDGRAQAQGLKADNGVVSIEGAQIRSILT
jgi:hypothetical protein